MPALFNGNHVDKRLRNKNEISVEMEECVRL
jgi:hypothetical protein